MMTAAMRRIQLKCGRSLTFREYGDLEHGFPVIFAHGNLNSRSFKPCWGKTEEVTKSAGIRLIAVDRPGYGGSHFEENRTYLGWAKDIDDFSSQLGLSSFVVAGFSSGGPHALSCGVSEKLVGKSLFSKVAGVCLISSDAPYARLGEEFIKKVYNLTPPITMEKAIDRTQGNYEAMKSAYENIKNEEKRKIALADIEDAVAQGLTGPAYDILLETGDWFDFNEIQKPVLHYHGDADHDVPVDCAHFIQKNLPKIEGSQLHIIKDENHTLLRRQWKSILENIKTSFQGHGNDANTAAL